MPKRSTKPQTNRAGTGRQHDAAAVTGEFPDWNPHPIARVSADGVVLYANQAAKEVLESCGSGPLKPAPAAWSQWVAEALRTRTQMDTEFQHDDRTLALTIVPVEGYANLYGRDITDLKNTQAALRQSEEKYRNFFNNAQVGMVRVRVSDGKVLDANDKFVQMLGYASREQMAAECVLQNHYVDPHAREQMLDEIRRAGKVTGFEAQLIRKDGSRFWVRFSAYLYAEPDYIEGVAIDITEEREAIESLRESEERFRELFEYAHDLILTIDSATHRITTVNNASRDVLSYDPDDLVGKPFTMFINPDFVGAVEEHLGQAIEGTPTTVEAWCRRKDGTPVLIDFRMRGIGTVVGRAPQVSVIAYDETERRRESEAAKRLSLVLQQRVREETASLAEANNRLRRIQAQLIQSEKLAALGQLAAGVSHEINNPLSFVSNNLVVLRRDFQTVLEVYRTFRRAIDERDPARRMALIAEAEAQTEQANIDYITANLDRIFNRTIEGTDRIRKIVRDMLDFARLGEAEWKEADINQAIETTISILTHDIKSRNVELVRDFRPLPSVYCMPGRLNHVFLNILLNAVQAVPEGGKIIVSTWAYRSGVKVAIADNGMGIPKENLGRIFDPFFTTKPRGTGLGLSISYTIIAEHGGQIEVESEVGRGTTFTITVPSRKPSERNGAADRTEM
ncbi:MAG TPA: PAS domain S-box protein [Planctomycetota bacterium]|nr:PAS domain S-box protein [Planctomycetota bacterium]